METKQYNLKLPKNLAKDIEAFVELNGYRNVQELISESLREKLEQFKIKVLDDYITRQIEEGKLHSEEELWAALRTSDDGEVSKKSRKTRRKVKTSRKK